MPRFKQTDEAARLRLRPGPGRADARAPFREAINGLQGEDIVEIQPEGAETMRGLKVSVSRAAKETHSQVTYGETFDGTLLVWRRVETGRRRGRRRAEAGSS